MDNASLYIKSIIANWIHPDPEIYRDEKTHIWRVKVSDFFVELDRFKLLLTAEESKKILRYKSNLNQQTRIIGRATLKILLGRYLFTKPEEISFESDEQKKPVLRNANHKSVHFNISHSGDWILIAIATNAVGIDLEYTDASFTYQNLLDFSFDASEKNYIQTSKLPYQSFYKLWTRKEALLKATGKGLIDELALIPSLNGNHLNPNHLTNSVESWQITSFNIDENHIASAAFRPVKTVLQFLNFKL